MRSLREFRVNLYRGTPHLLVLVSLYSFFASICFVFLSLPPPRKYLYRTPFFSSPANPAPAQGYTSVQEDISYRPTQQSFVYEVEDLVREALKRDIRCVCVRVCVRKCQCAPACKAAVTPSLLSDHTTTTVEGNSTRLNYVMYIQYKTATGRLGEGHTNQSQMLIT